MEFVPLRFLSRFSAGVPAPARSASVFLTTLYLPPAACTARRSLVSSSTVMPWNVESMTVETLASSVFSLSRSCCFSLRFFIISLLVSRALLRGSGQRLQFGQVDGDARTHGRGQCNFLDVLAFGGSWLGLYHRVNHRMRIFRKLCGVKLNLSDGTVNDSGLVHAEFHFAGFHFLDRLGNLKRDRASLRIGHQAARAEHFAELAGGAHHIRRGDHSVVVHPAFHD